MMGEGRVFVGIALGVVGFLSLSPTLAHSEQETKSGVRPQVISLPEGPGAIEGLGESFEPQMNMGSGKYAIPLTVPPGRVGFAPDLRLSYDGGNGNGSMGMGWQLSFMCVKRQTDKGLPRYGSSNSSHPDAFINELGEELVRVQGNEADESQVFRLKNEESFKRYEYILNENRWVLTDKSGVRYFLGARMDNTDVSARVQRPADNATFAWYIGEAIDTNGNRILYSYERDQQQIYCKLIEYGAIEKGTPTSRHQIEFEYEGRDDPVIDYRPTFRLLTAKRLKQIHISSGGKLVRRYRLDYIEGRPLSMLSRLTSIGSDGISTLPPAEFEYTAGTPAQTGSLIPLQGLSGASILLTGENPDMYPGACEILDFDGDSLPDLYQSRHPASDPFEYDVFYENLGAGKFLRKPFSQSESLGLKIQSASSFVQDISGDGLADLVAQKGANPEDLVFRLNEGGRWAASDTAFIFPGGETAEKVFKSPDIRALDLDSDKLIDTLRSYRSTGPSGTGIVFAAYLNGGDGTLGYIPQTADDILRGLTVTFSESNGALTIADMNGDRMQDIVLLRDATNGGPKYWPATGFGKFDDSVSGYVVPLTNGPDFGGDPAQIKKLDVGDLNGDGLADLYHIAGGRIRYWLNEGGTKFGPEASISIDGQFDPTAATYRLADVDGDGLQDILFYVRSQPTPDYLPRGFGYVRLFADNAGRLEDHIDNDGDGQVDEADEGNSAPNILCVIKNGIGRATSLLYSSHVEDMVRDRLAGQPWVTVVPFPVPVLRCIDVYDGLNATYHREFFYHDGYYDGHEKEFRGFARAEQREVGDASAPDLIMAYEYDIGKDDEALKGKPLSLEAQTAGKNVFYREDYTWATRKLTDGAAGDERDVTFAYQQAKARDILERGSGSPVRLEWEYEYDDYGNMTRQVEHGRMDAGWDDERVTLTSYTAGYPSGQSNWILDKVVESTTTDENGVWIANKRNFYDGTSTLGQVITKGNLTVVRDWVAGNDYVTSTRNDYDTYGNVIATKDPLYGVEAGHYRQFAYDPTYHTFPIEERINTGSLTLVMSATYDYGFGAMTSSTEFNNHTTTYGYDTFGRLTSITKPPDMGHTVDYSYVLAHDLGGGKLINWVETRQRDDSAGDGFLKSRTFYDGLGRKVMTRAEGENAGQVVVTDTVKFNERKVPWKKYLPYFETGSLDFTEPTFNTGFTEHFYDALGREIRVNQPAGPEGVVYSTTEYKPLIKTVRDEEQTKLASPRYGCGMKYVEDGLQDKDGNGRIREVYEIVKLTDAGEPLGNTVEWRTRYLYDLLDNLTGYMDSQNNQKFIQYDGLSRKTFMDDPDRGHMTYHYDAASNLVKTVDAKGQIIEYAYDGVNRLTAEYYGAGKTIPDVEYHYDLPYGVVDRGDLWQLNQARDIAEDILYDDGTAGLGPDLNNDGALDVSDVVRAAREPQQTNTVTAANTRGYLSWVRDQSGEEHDSYDSRGRVRWVVKRIVNTGPSDLRNFYSAVRYDSMDRIIQQTYPDGTYVTYTYNPRGLLEATPNVVNRLDYNPAGQNSLLELACGVVTTYEYDHRLRLSRLNSLRTRDNLELQDLNYTYDGVSNITQITDGRNNDALDLIGQELGIASAEARKFNATESFGYDSLYRLTYAANPSVYGTINYRYDRIGNMVLKDASLLDPDPLMDLGAMTSGGAAGSWARIGRLPGAPAGPHAVTGTEKGPGELPMTFTYDDNGNMTSDRGMNLLWDYKDRLSDLTNNTKAGQYLYDYTDTRKKKTVSSSDPSFGTIVFYVDKFCELRDGKLLKYVYQGNNRIARSDVQSDSYTDLHPSSFNIYDHLGSSVFSLSDLGTIIEQTVNYVYGYPRREVSLSTASCPSKYKFVGKERDQESALQYFESRYLNNAYAQFLSADFLLEDRLTRFICFPQRLNPYSYCVNSPINRIDVNGTQDEAVMGSDVGDGGYDNDPSLGETIKDIKKEFNEHPLIEALKEMDPEGISGETIEKINKALEGTSAAADVHEAYKAYEEGKTGKAIELTGRALEKASSFVKHPLAKPYVDYFARGLQITGQHVQKVEEAVRNTQAAMRSLENPPQSRQWRGSPPPESPGAYYIKVRYSDGSVRTMSLNADKPLFE